MFIVYIKDMIYILTAWLACELADKSQSRPRARADVS